MFTKQVQLFFGWPVIQSIVTALNFSAVVFIEQLYFTVDLILLDLMEDKNICCFGQRWEMETMSNVLLRTAGDKELDSRDLIYKLTNDREGS